MLQKTIDCVNSDVNSNVVPFRPVAGSNNECERGVVVKADLDDGYLRLSNTLVDKLCMTSITGRQFRVLMAIIKKTYGFNKKTDWISASQICELMNYEGASTHISADIRELKRRNIIVGEGVRIGPNSIVSEWILLPKKTNNKDITPDRKRSHKEPKTVTPLTESGHNNDRKRSTQKKDNTTKERQKDICAKSSFNDFFKAYPNHRKGGSDSAAWTAWKSEKLTDQDCKAAVEWLAQAAQRDPSWGVNASGQFVLGVTKFIRTKTWLTPLPQVVNRQANPLHTPAHSVDHNPYADFANDFNTEL
jgi:phage replication O-like protein O